jgi:glycosyltransferase involved in cell wall biosynthesis
VIPVFDHAGPIGSMVDGVIEAGLHCILVDDGSSDPCAGVLASIAAARPEAVTLVRHQRNLGKGAAVLSGCRRAHALGYDHVLQIDADGQHRVEEIPAFLRAAAARPDAVIAGTPVYDASITRTRLYFRFLTHAMVWLNTLSFRVRDTMCGFRVYPLASLLALADRVRLGRRMDFDIEVLVRLDWDGVPIENRPTPVRYPIDGVSHFLMWRDNMLITRLHLVLFLGMLRRSPMLIARHWKGP